MTVRFQEMKEREITEIYETRMCKDFPAIELKPLHSIIDMMEQGVYQSLLVFDRKEPVGYALLLMNSGFSYGLLDYLGVFADKREYGYGGRILAALKEYYSDKTIFIESEYPKDAPDEKMARRRINFYQRNGALDTGVESRIFGAHYVNFILGENTRELTKEAVIDALEQMYGIMVPDPVKRKKYLQFWIRG